jgi:parvulin-like peptidyl-prolyl isomerase
VLLANDANREAQRAEMSRIREMALAPGADFAALAEAESEAGTRKDGGLIGTVTNGDLAPPLEAAAFSVPVGSISETIEMPHGFHLLKVEERLEPRKKSVEELKETIRRKIEDDKYQTALEAYLKKARAESEIVVNESYKDRFKPAAKP